MAAAKISRSSISIDHRGGADSNKGKDDRLLVRLRQLSYPLDYEKEISSNTDHHSHDPLQFMLNFPVDDVSAATKSRQLRTIRSTVPSNALSEATNAFVRETLRSYTVDWNIIRTKYNEYSGNFTKLPTTILRNRDTLREQKFEIDIMDDEIDSIIVEEGIQVKLPKELVSMKGYLTIAPNSNDTSVTLKSNRRMWFFLKTSTDSSYIIEYFKGRESHLASGSILLPESTRLAKFTYDTRQFGFSLQLPDMTYGLIADSLAERDQWYDTLCKALGSEKFIEENSDKQPNTQRYSSLRDSLLHSRCPDLIKYAKEIDFQNALKRTESNRKLFSIYPDLESAEKFAQDEGLPEAVSFIEQLGTRFILRPKELLFRLNMNIENVVSNVEPFFISVALYNVQDNLKISEDIHFDLNHSIIRDNLPEGEARFSNEGEEVIDGTTSGNNSGGINRNHMAVFDNRAYTYKQEAVFSVTCPSTHVYMVVRIEKVLQGSISACVEPYIKGADNPKIAQRVHKQVTSICGRLGNYRMPFGWAYKPVFKNTNGELDPQEFSPIFKQDSGKLSDEDLLKFLADSNKIKLPTIPGHFVAVLESLGADQPENCVTPSIQPIKPFKSQDSSLPTPVIREVDEFLTANPKALQPHLSYYNNLYVYPITIRFDGQKTFARARNLAWTVSFYDSDDVQASALKCIYGEGMQAEFVSIGYAWLPILQDGRIIGNEHSLPVAKKISPGYLSSQSLGLKRGFSGPQEMEWVDGGRPLLKVSTSLKSTIYSQDPHFQKFFSNYQQSNASTLSNVEIIQLMKALHAVELNTLIPFLPVLSNHLFRVLRRYQNADVSVTALSVLIYMAFKLHSAGRTELLNSYVKYSWFFFDIMVKSMAQYLVQTGKLKANRIFRYSDHYLNDLEELIVAMLKQIRNKADDAPATNANQNLGHFLKKTMRMKFDFLQIICSHEHYIPLNLPYEEKPPATFDLTDDFHKKHPLVGLLLKEVQTAMQQHDSNVRKHALKVLRNLLIKHDLDDRYNDKICQARIAMLYVRFFSIVFQNSHKIKASKAVIPPDSAPVSPFPSDDIGSMAPSSSCQSLTSIGRGTTTTNTNGSTANTSVFDRYATHNKSFSGTAIPVIPVQIDDGLSKDLSSSSTSLNKSAPMRSVSSSVINIDNIHI
ncbi:uncharacterized protein TRIADDRAFT_52201 [Trichoplax adhaerens]|uniref:PH domain-containing protein n=1 Tax=Trichoplax adhaerens TaxID=10228 RepID=B3RM18_TRIAD|nr:hypothetical protein TRIADDRAFT_52201 [Trichoplax adhaerens]EDV29621.1 hypothetical protein TRIADDRAFT_52201 [Trichoplax adhaerens]|eukprot:XP_002108823.1 hypothetical protein TRIADDRAFT_52201 [Trichoplax adhaerens]